MISTAGLDRSRLSLSVQSVGCIDLRGIVPTSNLFEIHLSQAGHTPDDRLKATLPSNLNLM